MSQTRHSAQKHALGPRNGTFSELTVLMDEWVIPILRYTIKWVRLPMQIGKGRILYSFAAPLWLLAYYPRKNQPLFLGIKVKQGKSVICGFYRYPYEQPYQ